MGEVWGRSPISLKSYFLVRHFSLHGATQSMAENVVEQVFEFQGEPDWDALSLTAPSGKT